MERQINKFFKWASVLTIISREQKINSTGANSIQEETPYYYMESKKAIMKTRMT